MSADRRIRSRLRDRGMVGVLAVVFVALVIVPAGPASAAVTVEGGRYENTSAAIAYSGMWSTASSGSDSGGSISTLATAGYAELTFTETSIKWTARTANYLGIANVYLDGTLVTTVDLYSAANTFKVLAYTSPTLSYGTHTLRIERTGTKNNASSGRTIDIDSFIVADTRVPATPTGLTAAPEGAGARLNWTPNTETDLTGYLIYRATGTSSTYETLTANPITTTTYLDPALTPGTDYRYRIAAVDTSANQSPRTTDATMTASTAAVGSGTYENTSSAITYSGIWGSLTSSSDSGGSISTLAGTGYAQIAFKETSVRWIARTGNFLGIANVYLDGTLVTTVDLYSAANTFKVLAYTSPTLSYGTHTLRIERTGTKNNASSGRTIDIDSFIVADTRVPATPTGLTAAPEGAGARLNWTPNTETDLTGYLIYRATGTSSTYETLTTNPITTTTYLDPALTPGTDYRYRIAAVDTSANQSPRTTDATMTASTAAVGSGTYENTSSAITYSGIWGSLTSSSDSGGSISTLAGTGYAQIAFKETSVRWIARTGNFLGIANVYLDGTLVTTVDLYSAANTFKVLAYTSPTLSYGTHTLRIERTGTKNNASSGRTIDIDSFIVADTRVPATPTGLTAAPEGAGARLNWTPNTETDLTGYLIYRATGTSSTYETLTANPITTTTYLDPALTPGTDYRYRIAAVDTSANQSPRTTDATMTASTATAGAGTVENTSDLPTYVGTWATSSSASDSGGSSASLATPGYVQVAFTETSIKWIARTGNYFGIANVYLDGTLVTTVDLYSAAAAYKVVAYTSPTLSYGAHTLRIERSGNKNAASTGRTVSLDSFVIADTRAPATPIALKAKPEAHGVRLSWTANTETDLAGYLIYRAPAGSSAYESLTDFPINDTTFLDPELTLNSSYRYRISAVDASANESPRTTDAETRTAAGPGTYRADSSAVKLDGSWSADVDSGSGENVGQFTTGTGYASLVFYETGVRWIGSKTPNSGVAKVHIDGDWVATIDQYSPTTVRGVKLFEKKDLGPGSHTVKVYWTGEHDPAVTEPDVRTSVTSFVVADTTAPESPRSIWAAPAGTGIQVEWSESTEADVAGYRVYRSAGSQTSYEPIDTGLIQESSLLDDPLTPGLMYRYQVTAVDASGNESEPSTVASATTAVSTGTHENTSAAITFTGGWTTASSTRDSGGNYATLTSTGDARFSFSGTGIKWVTRTNNYSGIAQVYIDGVPVIKVDLYSATQLFQQTVFSKLGLPDGTHTIRVERTGTLNPASTGRGISLDAFVVLDSTAPTAVAVPSLTNTRMGINVEWQASAAADAAAYRLFRTASNDVTEVLMDRLPPTQLSFLDVGLTPGVTYTYRLTALDTSGNESASSPTATLQATSAAAAVTERYANCPAATRAVATSGTLQYAMKTAAPGDVIVLAPGTYKGNFVTSVSATAGNPVWICGPRNAVVDNVDPTTGGAGMSMSNASHVILTGLTMRNVQKGVMVSGGSHNTISDLALAGHRGGGACTCGRTPPTTWSSATRSSVRACFSLNMARAFTSARTPMPGAPTQRANPTAAIGTPFWTT